MRNSDGHLFAMHMDYVHITTHTKGLENGCCIKHHTVDTSQLLKERDHDGVDKLWGVPTLKDGQGVAHCLW